MNDRQPATDFDARNAAFLAFLRAEGAAVSDAVAIRDYSAEHAGRGVAATRDVAADEQLFALPYSACLGVETSRAAGWIKEHPELAENGWAPVILAVLYELAFADTSKFKPYFDILPSTLDTPIFWTASELALLEGTDVVRRMAKEESDSMYHSLLLPVVRQHVPENDWPRFSIDRFYFAASLLMAYGFHPGHIPGVHSAPTEEDESDDEEEEEEDALPILVPLADTLNAVHPSTAHLEHDADARLLRIHATADVSAGSQIFNTYGDHGTSELLRRYGYVEWTNAFDAVTLDGPALLELAAAAIATSWGKKMKEKEIEAELEKRVDFLSEIDVFEDEFEVSRDRPVPADLVLSAKLLLADPDTYRAAKKDPSRVFPTLESYTSAAPTDRVAAPVHLTRAEADLLVALADHRLAMYPADTPADGVAVEECAGIAEFVDKVNEVAGTGGVRAAYAAFVRRVERGLVRRLRDAVVGAGTVKTWDVARKEADKEVEGQEEVGKVVVVEQADYGVAKKRAAEAPAAAGKHGKKAKRK
ncbi:Ribosomal lysine N-methyltransferase 4 [Blastocladiella emersonii ATCC 22665]|nr:Ribosomal lysine N-methyltransferase 4 [Blastocladiella emersonii ATCC 22665]